MNIKKISLTTQIKKVIGNRILFCSVAFMIIIFGLTIYDLSNSITQLRSRINEQIKPIEDFAIDQGIINNLDTVELKIDSFNESNSTFKIEWVRKGVPVYKSITWRFPFSWVYDYQIGNIAGYQFGYFKVTGGFLSDKTLIYDLLLRIILLVIFTVAILSILFPLAKKIPEQLFINPINRFIDLVSNNSVNNEAVVEQLPVELEVLEEKILALLKTATEHERNKAAIELGHLSARLAHDIRSPLAAMEMGLRQLAKKVPYQELMVLTNGIESVRGIADNVLERYRNPNTDITSASYDDVNRIRPILLLTLTEMIISQKRHEWHQQPCEVKLIVQPEAKISWIEAAPNEVKRLLSNLLNNAYDALIDKSKGVIHILLSTLDDKLHLQIEDNGIGIPADRMNDVLNGVSLKHSGQGLGLSMAKQYMESLSGKLNITSTIGKGTTVSLVFPRSNSLSWFPSQISLRDTTTVMVLDDDFSMLMYWQQRISEAGLIPKLFSTYGKALQWVEDNIESTATTIFLADYELAESDNGLTLLKKIEDNNNRYLITSHAEELQFQLAAVEAGVWLIPKLLVDEIAVAL